MDLSIIVPCYNESKNLERLVNAFRGAVAGHRDVEVVLVDNGSRDDTAQVLDTLLSRPENAFARSVKVEVNQGYGYGIMYGLERGRGRFLAWTHADMQTPPEDCIRAWELIRMLPDPEHALVRGTRRGRPVFDQLFTTGMGWVASAALGSRLFDVNAQPKVFHRSLLAEMTQAPHDFTLDLYLLFRASQIGIEQHLIEVRFDRRTAGEAKGGGSLKGKMKLCKRTLTQIWSLRKKLREAGSSATSPRSLDSSIDSQTQKTSAQTKAAQKKAA